MGRQGSGDLARIATRIVRSPYRFPAVGHFCPSAAIAIGRIAAIARRQVSRHADRDGVGARPDTRLIRPDERSGLWRMAEWRTHAWACWEAVRLDGAWPPGSRAEDTM